MAPQRSTPRFATPRGDTPRGAAQRGVNPRIVTPRDQGKARSRSVARPDIRRGDSAKSRLTGREAVRQRDVERRQQAIERRQQAGDRQQQRALERRQTTGKARDNLQGKTDRVAGDRAERRAQRALVRRGNGERALVLRNRGLAERSARTPAQRALASATFGGRYASRFRDGDRRHGRHRHHRHVHVIGWVGPLFWPYAYNDFVDYTYWPYAYDSFWPYAYDDVYEGFFGPYSVGGSAYAAVPSGPAPRGTVGTSGTRTGTAGRPATRNLAGAAQICTGESDGLTNWPVERIAVAINPDDTQRAALNRLREAAERAVNVLRSACPDDLPSTPAGRMAAMRQRLEAMREAVQIVRPELDRFYASLNDEQKARFNALEPQQSTASIQKANRAELSQVCGTAVTKTNEVPRARIEQALRLSSEQRSALDNLDAATSKAAEVFATECPGEETLTPPGRLTAMEARLEAMLKALDIVQPALTQFYDSLSDEQKARFNQLGARQQANR